MSESTVRAVIYARISMDRGGAGLGVARQEKDCRSLCKRERWQVADVLVDNDQSAYRGKKRAGYEQLLEGVAAGRWDVVVAWHPDRLTRHPKELESLIDTLNASGTTVRTVMAGEYDLSTATGRMTARVVGAVARHESEQKAERTKRKHLELVERGLDPGGARMFGYQSDRVTVDHVEAALIRRAAEDVLAGVPLAAICRRMNDAGITTTRGNRWAHQTLRRLLVSPRLAGYREYGGKLHPASWEPILDEMTWRRVKAVLEHRTPGRPPRDYLLTGGLARCRLCEHPLIARPRTGGLRSYVCASSRGGCGKLRIDADGLEEEVSDRVYATIQAGRIPSVTPPDVEGTLAELAATEASLAELADDYYTHRAVTKAQFQAASKSLADKLDSLRGRLAEPQVQVDPSELDGWGDPSVRRGLVERMVVSVWVGPAVKGLNFFDPRRVEIDWR